MPLLFSYGTLRQENVQLATFGRLLVGNEDSLVGFEQSMVKIEDQQVVATSGKTHHPIVKFTGHAEDRVPGTVFEVTDSELEHADAYEVDAYKRVLAKLASGKQAWVYVDAQFAPRGYPVEGGCDCRYIRYRLVTAPMIVHCCQCRWCQRESGAAFALNAMYEADRVVPLENEPEVIDTPSASGAGQKIARCPKCRVAVWSHYAGSGPVIKFVRVGTVDDPDMMPPDVHIFTSSKQPWVIIPPETPAFAEYYDRKVVWSAEALARRKHLLPQIEAYQAARR